MPKAGMDTKGQRVEACHLFSHREAAPGHFWQPLIVRISVVPCARMPHPSRP